MFVVYRLLLLAALGFSAAINHEFQPNVSGTIIQNRMVSTGVYQMGITKLLGVGNIRRRAPASKIQNPVIGDIYMVSMQIGTPPQPITLSVDTGSSDVWVNPTCSTSGWNTFCVKYPRFDRTKSSSFQPTSQPLNLAYGTGQVTGAYGIDNFLMAPGPTIKNLQFGVATSSKSLFAGIMGMSWGLGLGTGYYNIVDQLALQRITQTRAFSMDLGNVDTASGSIIFGGVDTKKYYGSFVKNAIIPFYNSPDGFPRYWINMTSVSIRLNGQTEDSAITSPGFSLAVIMDSGSTLSYFPPSLINAILAYFPGYVAKGGGLYTVPCSFKTGNATMNFGFNGQIIRIPLAQFIWFNGATCYGPVANPSEKRDAILGDTFMRGAYVVFDQDNANVHIAQAANCGTNIVPIKKGVNGVPSAVGDCPVPVAT
ncbi:hypothetical protein ACMFMG_007774 [Clarireedia jacksonii]